MNYYYDAILQASEYIEANLTNELKVEEIAQKVGFSQFHFMRVFRAVCGHTVNNYVKRRRITEAAKVLVESDMRIIDVAALYGYNSQEAFTRAFKEIYDVPPNMYRTLKIDCKNVEQIIIDEKILDMRKASIRPIEPQIIGKEDFIIAGMKYKGRNGNFEVPKLWNGLRDKIELLQNRVNENVCYGLESYDEDFSKYGYFEYIAGVQVVDNNDIPEDMDIKRINKSKYAVFPIPAVIENISKNISEIYSFHLPNSGLKAIGNYDFEYYDTSFEANNYNSYISLYIPVEE